MRGRVRGKKAPDEPQPIGALLSKVYPSQEPDDAAGLRAFAWWAKAVPPRVLAHARPVRLRHGILTVHADSSSWVSDLSFAREQLLQSVKRAAPGANVRDLRIVVGPLPALPPRIAEQAAPLTKPIPLQDLPEEVARAIASIRDESLRNLVAHTAATSLGEAPPKRRQ